MMMDEDEAIRSAIQQSYSWASRVTYIDTVSQNYDKKPVINNQQQTPVHSSYVCHRCKHTGHYISKCPTNGDKAFDKPRARTQGAGIPRKLTICIDTDKINEHPDAFIGKDGKYYLPVASDGVFKKEVGMMVKSRVPILFECRLCRKLMKDAVQLPCCGVSFCHGCILPPHLFYDNFVDCPLCKNDCMIKKIVPNSVMRKDVAIYRRDMHLK